MKGNSFTRDSTGRSCHNTTAAEYARMYWVGNHFVGKLRSLFIDSQLQRYYLEEDMKEIKKQATEKTKIRMKNGLVFI